MSHGLRVKAILKPYVSSNDAYVAFTRGKKRRLAGFTRAASITNRLCVWQLSPNDYGCAIHNGF